MKEVKVIFNDVSSESTSHFFLLNICGSAIGNHISRTILETSFGYIGQFGHKVDKLVLVITALLGFFVRSSVVVGFLRRITFVIRVISRGHQGGGYFQMLER
jgi:hypothetical protein